MITLIPLLQRIMSRYLKIWVVALLYFLPAVTQAQLLPPNRPEQDACNALKICGNGFSSPYSYQGHGQIADLTNTPCGLAGGSPPGAGEDNSVWLKLEITAPGTIVFNITPVTIADDYDFAVVDITNTGCSNFTSANVVRCNFNNNQPIANNGVVGLSMTATAVGVPAGTFGSPYCRYIDALAGQVYLIMLNNFGTGNNNISSGFNINFTGSTAVFNDQIPPAMVSATNACFRSSGTLVQLSEQIKCGSIAGNGSDFILSPSGTIVSATGINCNNANQGYTDKVQLAFSPALAPGVYTLSGKVGSDNNTLLDLCDNALVTPGSITFTVYPDESVKRIKDTAACWQMTYRGRVYTQSTVLTDTIRNQRGCDSVYNITNITIYREPIQVSEVVGGCDSVIFRGITYNENAVVIDTFVNSLGCDSLVHTYNIYAEHFELSVTADPPEPVKGDYVLFTTSSNVEGYRVNAWLPKPVFNNQFALNHSIIIRQSDTVKVIGQSPIGCIDTAVLYIKADSLIPVLVMPNAFSPNGDGLNDVFEPKFVNKSGYVVKDFKVFNRWGQLVYKAQGTKKAGWNGYYSNQDKKAEPGTYFYMISVEFIDDTKETVKGDVTLIY